MPELREVFEMTTRQMEPDTDAWREQEQRRRRRAAKQKAGVYILVAALGIVAAIALVLGTRGEPNATTPAGEPTVGLDPAAVVGDTDTVAVGLATAFVEAYGAFDVDQAISLLADHADIFGGTLRDFRLRVSWFEAMGYKHISGPCEVLGSSDSGKRVRCPYDFHALRSEKIGLGPFSGSFFDLTIDHGTIVQVSDYLNYEDEFSPQMWEPFAEWVSKTYPEDAAAMYTDETLSSGRFTEKSFRLWEEHSREYAKEVGPG